MTRRDFLKLCSLLGISLSLPTSFSTSQNNSNFKGKALIIGAGAAGLTAAYLLNQQNIDFQVLEASPTHGGRMQRTLDFADFPIPLGAEWLHVERDIFDEIINDDQTQLTIETTPYNHDTDWGLYEGNRIPITEMFDIDQKFINATWFDFFESYVVPSVQKNISYNTVVESIDYSGEGVKVKTADTSFEADVVIVTVPVKMLQNESISFTPELPRNKRDALNKVKVWNGCKAFIEFSEKFYPTFVGFDTKPVRAGQKLYYDAAYAQSSNQNILGLFAVGSEATPYIEASSEELLQLMLTELDATFDGQASQHYVKHIFQNWNAEPFIGGAYVNDHESWRRVRTLGEFFSDKLFFAGEAYTDGEDWGSVHTAARSAKRVIEELI